MSRSSPRKRPAVNYSEGADEKQKEKKDSAASKALSRLKSLAAKIPPKRKADSEATTDDTKATAPGAPASKKRKTTKSNEKDAMPLTERTAVGSLKKAMYIGAHVSAAGG